MLPKWGRQFALLFGGWLLVSLVVFLVLGVFTTLLYFLSSYAGYLLAVEYSAPQGTRPPGHRRLRWVSLAGFVVFLYVVADWVWRVALAGTA